MLMHQGLGLARLNDLPRRKAVHALYECCCSVAWASRVADGRTYDSHAELLSAADAELAELSNTDLDALAATLPETGRLCAGIDTDTRGALEIAARAYEERFGYRYIASQLFGSAEFEAREILVDVGHRLDNDDRTERIVMRSEFSQINNFRLDRLLGPEGGWPQF